MRQSRIVNYIGGTLFFAFLGGYIGGCYGYIRDISDIVQGKDAQTIQNFDIPKMHEGFKNGAGIGLLVGLTAAGLVSLSEKIGIGFDSPTEKRR